VTAARYDKSMTFAQRKLLVLAAWAAMVVTAGLMLAIDNPVSWVLIGSLAIIPVLLGYQFWIAPEPTLSELIARTRSSRS
jgi:hypothetical protein